MLTNVDTPGTLPAWDCVPCPLWASSPGSRAGRAGTVWLCAGRLPPLFPACYLEVLPRWVHFLHQVLGMTYACPGTGQTCAHPLFLFWFVAVY